MRKAKEILFSLIAFAAISCSEKEVRTEEIQQEPIQAVTLDDALRKLNEFLQSSESGMAMTKSGAGREIESITTYYGEDALTSVSTKSDDEEAVGTAYLVNFANNEGFAVLGANTAVDDIIAVVENGSIMEDLTVVIDAEYEEEKGIDDISDFSFFFDDEEDSTYLEENTAAFVSECIAEGVAVQNKRKATTTRYATREPLLTYSWGQRSPYNRYCKRGAKNNKEALTGCSTTAMAMIVAFNEFPDTLIVNGLKLDWSIMKSSVFLDDSSDENEKDHVARLMGSIYNGVTKTTGKDYTMITAKQIKNRMADFGYDVTMYSGENYNDKMIKATSDMLEKGCPVFISAIPKKWSYAHSWVIDGAKYSSSDSNKYLVHCNFGWSGMFNGYFSTSCLNPSKGEEYDGYVPDDPEYEYTWHFRVITYDIPSSSGAKNIKF